ncbi:MULTISPECIES: MFS transporter [Streptococcus]|uniref:MFS transporter n=1 Tax=Streptococcus caledonicus TaxID=2614158 RepID=A0ABW0UHR4_9STRE|nr:MFS transporter [Streptococcus sp. S784/96/1]
MKKEGDMMRRYHKAWTVLAVLCGLAAAAIGVSINTSGVFYTVVSEDLGMLRGAFAFHMTIFSLVTAISALFVPNLLSRYPLKLVLTFSVVMAVLGTALMAISSHLWQFYILGAIRGFSTGMFSIVTITLIINQWFKEKNGLATSIALGFSGLVGTVFSPIFSEVIVHIGWRGAYGFEALLIGLLCLPAILYPFTMTPEDEGSEAYGKQSLKNDQVIMSQDKNPSTGLSLGALLVFASLIGFMSSMTQHLPGYAASVGLSVTLGASLLSMGMLGNIIFKLVIGALSDRFGSLKATTVLLALALSGNLLLMQTQLTVFLLLAAFLFGSCYGLGSVSLALVTRDIFGDEAYGKRFPIISFAGNLGAALAFSIIGYIYDFTGSYFPTLIVLVVFLLISTISLFSAFYRRKMVREK